MKSITEAQYEKLHPYLPVQRGNVQLSNLQIINALLYILTNGCTWRGLPAVYGRWYTVYMRLYRWQQKGVLDRLLAAMQEQRLISLDIQSLSLDSSSVRVHQDATGAPKKKALRPSASHAVGERPRFI